MHAEHVAVRDLAVQSPEEHAVLRGLLDPRRRPQPVLVALPADVVGERLLHVEHQHRRPERDHLDQRPEPLPRLLGRKTIEEVGRGDDGDVLAAGRRRAARRITAYLLRGRFRSS